MTATRRVIYFCLAPLALTGNFPFVSEQEMMHRKKQEVWTERKKPRPPKFFLTEAERKDTETLRIQRWLDLADMALGQTGEADCDELFHPAKKPA